MNCKDGKHESIPIGYRKKGVKKEMVLSGKYQVIAKRYLARDKKYFNFLSEASKISLKLQGGVLNENESNEFKKKKYLKNSILGRKLEEAAKETNIKRKKMED
jgi:Predicted HD phosphohydrolase